MKQAVLWLLVILAFAGLLTLASARADDARTNRLYARAHLVEVQSSARQDMLAAMLPYVIFGSVAIGGLTLAAIVIYALVRRPGRELSAQVRIIETRTILILQPGERSRREVFKLLSGIGANDEYH